MVEAGGRERGRGGGGGEKEKGGRILDGKKKVFEKAKITCWDILYFLKPHCSQLDETLCFDKTIEGKNHLLHQRCWAPIIE